VTLNLSDLTDIVQLRNRGLPPDVVEKAVHCVFREIIKAPADGRRVELRGFGVLEVRQLEGGTRRNRRPAN
jgi:nucleoid DNA-binding protein